MFSRRFLCSWMWRRLSSGRMLLEEMALDGATHKPHCCSLKHPQGMQIVNAVIRMLTRFYLQRMMGTKTAKPDTLLDTEVSPSTGVPTQETTYLPKFFRHSMVRLRNYQPWSGVKDQISWEAFLTSRTASTRISSPPWRRPPAPFLPCTLFFTGDLTVHWNPTPTNLYLNSSSHRHPSNKRTATSTSTRVLCE
jgi:hypothetical protein